jgi:hypothetical protein
MARSVNGASWESFAIAAPRLAASGRRLLYGGEAIASAFLATVAPDGGPRLHPVFPVLAAGELWLFIVTMSPKYRDLRRNGRYALHALPPPGGGEEFFLRGDAVQVSDAAARAAVIAATAGRQGIHDFEALFRCSISVALHTRWEGWGTPAPWPTYEKWLA